MLRVLIFLVSLGARVARAMCRRRADLVMENLALRQQVTALTKERLRPPLDDADRAFWWRFEPRGLDGQLAYSSSTPTPLNPVESGSIPTVLDSDLPQPLSRPAAD